MHIGQAAMEVYKLTFDHDEYNKLIDEIEKDYAEMQKYNKLHPDKTIQHCEWCGCPVSKKDFFCFHTLEESK